MNSSSTLPEQKGVIALVNVDDPTFLTLSGCDFGGMELMRFSNGVDLSTRWVKENLPIAAIISQSEVISPDGIFLLETLQNSKYADVPFFLIAIKVNDIPLAGR